MTREWPLAYLIMWKKKGWEKCKEYVYSIEGKWYNMCVWCLYVYTHAYIKNKDKQ